jgi:hypothetical protein
VFPPYVKSYDETMVDPEFLADAEKLGINIKPVSGPALADLVACLRRQTSAELLARARGRETSVGGLRGST